MRKTLTAITAGLLLVAGQAAATANVQASARVGDRVGARAAASDDLQGTAIIPLIAIVAVILTVVALNDDSESD